MSQFTATPAEQSPTFEDQLRQIVREEIAAARQEEQRLDANEIAKSFVRNLTRYS